jgi:HD-like signal output (HDOD) protein
MGEKECAGGRVVELSAIVALDILDGDRKLCAHIGKKIWRGWGMSRILGEAGKSKHNASNRQGSRDNICSLTH